MIICGPVNPDFIEPESVNSESYRGYVILTTTYSPGEIVVSIHNSRGTLITRLQNGEQAKPMIDDWLYAQ